MQTRVLFQERSEDMRRLGSFILKRLGVDVTSVASDEALLRALTQGQWDLILIDLGSENDCVNAKKLRMAGYDGALIGFWDHAKLRHAQTATRCTEEWTKPLTLELVSRILARHSKETFESLMQRAAGERRSWDHLLNPNRDTGALRVFE